MLQVIVKTYKNTKQLSKYIKSKNLDILSINAGERRFLHNFIILIRGYTILKTKLLSFKSEDIPSWYSFHIDNAKFLV